MSVTTNGPRKFVGRQYPLAVLADYGAGSTDISQGFTIKLPPGAYIVSGKLTLATAFNGTTPVLTVKDSAASPVSLFGNVDATAVAVTQSLAADAGAYYPFGTTLTVAVSGGATSGLAYILLEYVQLGRENEVYSA